MALEEDLEQELQDMIAEADKEREEELSGDEDATDDDNQDDNQEEEEEDELDETDADDNDSDDNDSDNSKDNTSDDDDDNDVDEDNDDDEVIFEPIEVEIDGNKITVNSQEELMTLAKKGLKSVDIKPNVDSEVDTFVKQAGLTKADLTLLVDARNGDANAIAKLAEIAKVDVLDIEAEKAGEYKPTFEMQAQSEIDIVAGEILNDTEHATVFKETMVGLPTDFKQTISNDAGMLKAFSSHLKSGLAQEVLPQVRKEMALKGGTFFENYARLGQETARAKAAPQQEAKQEPKQERQMSDKEKKLRARADGGDKSSSSKKGKTTAEDIQNMSEEEFAKLIAPK